MLWIVEPVTPAAWVCTSSRRQIGAGETLRSLCPVIVMAMVSGTPKPIKSVTAECRVSWNATPCRGRRLPRAAATTDFFR